MKHIAAVLVLAALASACSAETLSGTCRISAGHNHDNDRNTVEVELKQTNCGSSHKDCGSSDHSGMPWSRWSGVSLAALTHDGAALDARLTGEAGEIRCAGTVQQGVLTGRYEFVPSESFVQKLSSMGFTGITAGEQQADLMLDVTTEWVQQLKQAGVSDMATSNLIPLRALDVNADYVRSMSSAGYSEVHADKLIEMKAVGVTPGTVRDAHELGFQPTQDELVQMSIFHVDRAFVERMRARGLKDLTIAKLVQIKIFKLDE